jgi:hypothetical protein
MLSRCYVLRTLSRGGAIVRHETPSTSNLDELRVCKRTPQLTQTQDLDPEETATQQDLPDSDLHRNKMAQNVLLETSMGSIVVELYNNHAPKVSVDGIVPRYY